MTNGGITEGHTENSGCSDLSPVTSFPNGSMRVFHGAGTTEEENNAGRWTNIPDATLLLPFGQCRRSGGSGATLRAVSLRKPAIEKEARLRPQHFTFGSGETRMQMQKNSMAGGLLGFAPPRSRYLL